MNKTDPREAIKELTLMIMYLTQFNESDRFGTNPDITWKGYDFNVVNELDKEDYIRRQGGCV